MIIDLDLVKRVESSAVQFGILEVDQLQALGVSGNPHLRALDGGALFAMGPGRYVNRGIGIGLGGTEPTELLDELEAFYSDAGLPAALEVCPWVPQTFVDELMRRDYRVDCFLDVFVHDLRVLPPKPEVAIVEVIGDELTKRWTDIHASQYAPGSAEAQTSNEFCAALSRVPGAVALMALTDGEPVANGSVTDINGVGWFGGAVTLERARGRGSQQALIAARLHRAVSMGCDIATITADPFGVSARNIRRAGFELAYTQVRMTKH